MGHRETGRRYVDVTVRIETTGEERLLPQDIGEHPVVEAVAALPRVVEVGWSGEVEFPHPAPERAARGAEEA